MSKFDKTNQYGMVAEIVLGGSVDHSAVYHIVGFSKWCDEAVALAKKWLKCDMEKFIPIKYQDCVEWIVRPPQETHTFYCPNGAVGWKYTPVKQGA